MVYNFKKITVVPACKDFLDIALSRTQRRTPTVVHKSYAISRIRQFYMRKVKFTQSTFHEKLSTIIDEFPRLDDVHPFYGDLLNVLYDKDHYKLALGQLNTARKHIDTVARDYIRLLKYGDSLYRCKQLKKAALGRMCGVMKRLSGSLAYLEQVRQHSSRLPSIDPNTRTLLVCGYPNVGKSSFVNKITRADVDVQPYAFTTKSLFVGHTDYKYLRWQVIDTPGILDHPLEDRNTIEMLSITALAHLRAAVLFFLDVSGSCGYSIAQQAALFHSIKALFADKPLIVVCNKIDLQPLETLPEEDRQLVMDMKKEASKCAAGMIENELEDNCLVTMSAVTEEGITNVKTTACDRLLQQRVEVKLKSKKLEDCLNRFHVATPRARDAKERPPCIPQAAIANAAMVSEGKKLEKDLEQQNGGAGVYSADMHKHYILADDSWKNDVMPEIADGKNVADYYGADIVERLAELEREEAAAAGEIAEYMMSEDDLSPEEMKALAAIRAKRERARQESRAKKTVAQNRSMVPRKHDKDREFTVERMGRHLVGLGMDPSAAIERMRSRSLSRRGRKRERSVGDGDSMDIDQPNKRLRSRSRSQSQPTVLVPGEGFKDSAEKMKAVKLGKKAMKQRNKLAKRGEADRVIYNLKPKHLFSGKRSTGKTERR